LPLIGSQGHSKKETIMTDIKPYLQKMVDRFADPAVQASLKGFTKSLQFKFSDTNEVWLIRAVDGKEATLTQEAIEKPDILVTMATDILSGIMDKKINGTTAYMQRKIQVKGSMEDLMKLQKIMM
jgi:putative sterol carrier protein